MPPEHVERGSPPLDRPRRLPDWWIVLPAFLALLVFRPWTPSAFPVWDYAEMLPLLRQSSGMIDAFQQLAEFTRLDGRANYLTYFQIAATWALVGDDPVGWQWQRAIFVLILGCIFAITARRLGATATAAAAGGLLVVLTVPATEGWLFLMGEPLATILLLLLLLMLRSERLLNAAVGPGLVAACALSVVLTKEFVGLLVPLVLLLGIGWNQEHGLDRVRLATHGRRLLPWLIGAGLIATWSVLSALRDAVPGAYAASFTMSGSAVSRVPELFEVMLLPMRFASAGHATLLYPANLAWILAVGVGVVTMLGMQRQSQQPSRHLILLLLAVPAMGAIAYSFWPRFSAFYAIPFTLGGVGLFVAALTCIERKSQPSGWAAVLLLAITVIGFTAIGGHRTSTDKRAIADLAAGVSGVLSRIETLDTVYVVRVGPGMHRWPVTGPELGRYAAAIEVVPNKPAVFVDADCETVAQRLQSPLANVAILNDQNPCGSLPQVSLNFIGVAPYRDWIGLEARVDTIRLQLVLPREAIIRPAR